VVFGKRSAHRFLWFRDWFSVGFLAGVRFVWSEGSLPGKKQGLDGVFCGGGIFV